MTVLKKVEDAPCLQRTANEIILMRGTGGISLLDRSSLSAVGER